MAIRIEEFDIGRRNYVRDYPERPDNPNIPDRNVQASSIADNDQQDFTTYYNPNYENALNMNEAERIRYARSRISKSRNIIKTKILFCIISIAIFLFTPFTVTMLMTGRIEGYISDSLIETRRVNVKYKNGSQAMDLSKYMAGVLAARLPLSNNVEVLKAESIMIRTEIYRCMGDKMVISSDELPMDYLSEKDMQNLWGDAYADNYNLITDCISVTGGMLLSYNGTLIEPLYHEISAGKTRDGISVLNNDGYRYLQSVECPNDLEAPDYLTVRTFTYEEFAKAFQNIYKDLNISVTNPSESIQIVSRCSADYVLNVQAGTKVMSGEEFSKILGLNSSCLWFEANNGSVKITTKGKGNGLGLSIYGANRLAEEGKNYEEILTYFYRNVTIMTE